MGFAVARGILQSGSCSGILQSGSCSGFRCCTRHSLALGTAGLHQDLSLWPQVWKGILKVPSVKGISVQGSELQHSCGKERDRSEVSLDKSTDKREAVDPALSGGALVRCAGSAGSVSLPRPWAAAI
jgi:hypothetical protein